MYLEELCSQHQVPLLEEEVAAKTEEYSFLAESAEALLVQLEDEVRAKEETLAKTTEEHIEKRTAPEELVDQLVHSGTFSAG